MVKNRRSLRKTALVLLIAVFAYLAPAVRADRPGWQQHQVDWRLTGGSRIKAVSYPEQKPPPTLAEQRGRRTTALSKKALPPEAASRLTATDAQSSAPIFAIAVNSPPTNGFVPWIAVTFTDERFDAEDMVFDAIPETSIVGNYLTANPQQDYAIGIFDTGASASLTGNAAAVRAGIFDADLITSNTIELTGATGSVFAWVSQPLGLFIDGLGAIDSNVMLTDTTGMVGEFNAAIIVGQTPEPNYPDLPTAIGSPMSVFYAASFHNDRQITVIRDSNIYTAPDIHLYDLNDPCIPVYSNVIPLELRPLGATAVQYIPFIDIFNPFEFVPSSPSIIVGNSSQSIFFIHSVDLYEGQEEAYDKDRFMLDTGAQITVIGSRIAARLNLDIANPEFEVEIQGVTGDITMTPGFYIDTIEIPALGQWLSFTNVPVIFLDIASPEGGTVDGIIGMNLFINFNLVLKGGGMFLQDDPTLSFEPVPYKIIADIAPLGGDGIVDFLDMAECIDAWLAIESPPSANWKPNCDMAPSPPQQGIINFLDFAVLAIHWLESIAP